MAIDSFNLWVDDNIARGVIDKDALANFAREIMDEIAKLKIIGEDSLKG